MILTRSPYYKNIPWLSPSSIITPNKYILQIFVWSGLKVDVPSLPTYEEENLNPLMLEGEMDIDISPYINSSINLHLTNGNDIELLDSNMSVWVKTQVLYYINDVEQSPELIETKLACKGYSYGMEGVNKDVVENSLLIDSTSLNVSVNSNYMIPIYGSEVDDIDINITSYPNNLINTDIVFVSTEDSNELVKYINIPIIFIGTDEYIEIKKDNEIVQTLILKEEYRHTPFDVYFINKYGVLSPLTFFKEKTDSLKVSKENYRGVSGQPIYGNHQYKDYNVNGITEFKANSGFIKEDNNDVFTQLLLSDNVWILENYNLTPVNIESSSLEYKTRKKDRLINYEISFKHSFNKVNNA